MYSQRMNVLSFLGTYAIYFWVLVTLLFGMFLEVCFVALFFYEWKDRRQAKKELEAGGEGTSLLSKRNF